MLTAFEKMLVFIPTPRIKARNFVLVSSNGGLFGHPQCHITQTITRGHRDFLNIAFIIKNNFTKPVRTDLAPGYVYEFPLITLSPDFLMCHREGSDTIFASYRDGSRQTETHDRTDYPTVKGDRVTVCVRKHDQAI